MYTTIRMILKTALLSISLLGIHLGGTFVHPATVAEAPEEKETSGGELKKEGAEKVHRMPLSEALMSKSLGFDYENLSDYSKRVLSNYGKSYVKYRSKKLSTDQEAEFIAGCFASPGLNPFCNFLGENWRDTWVEVNLSASRDEVIESSSDVARSIAYVRPKKSRVAEALREADIEFFRDELEEEEDAEKRVARGRIVGGLRKIDRWESLEPIVNKVLSSSECTTPELATALGQKAEEFFPDQKYRDISLKLYHKSMECSQSGNKAAGIARFRAGLLYVWNKDCANAEEVLRPLSEDTEGLYTTRATYWRARCVEQSGNKLLFSVMQNKLMKLNPLGYHTLVLNNDRAHRMEGMAIAKDPLVLYRSKKRPELNAFVRSIEVLIRLDEKRHARQKLHFLEDKLEDTEPTFKLYVAALAKRAGSPILPFKVLSSVFRHNPGLISRETLEIFYPLKHFSNLWKHRGQIDPYFLAALIRQESGFDRYARSHAGALGLMQLMPRTARQLARVSKKQLFWPKVNVRLGVKYLQNLLDRFDGDAELALAAYNAGPHRVKEWLSRYDVDNRMLFLDLIPFSETRNYVVLIGRNYYWYLNLYAAHSLSVGFKPDRKIASRSKKVVFRAFQSI